MSSTCRVLPRSAVIPLPRIGKTGNRESEHRRASFPSYGLRDKRWPTPLVRLGSEGLESIAIAPASLFLAFFCTGMQKRVRRPWIMSNLCLAGRVFDLLPLPWETVALIHARTHHCSEYGCSLIGARARSLLQTFR